MLIVIPRADIISKRHARKVFPEIPNCSPAANAAGITELRGASETGPCESSVSRGVSQHSIRKRRLDGPTHDVRSDYRAPLATIGRANSIAARPDESQSPKSSQLAYQKVGCFRFLDHSSGSARSLRSLMYLLSLSMTGLTPCAVSPSWPLRGQREPGRNNRSCERQASEF